MKNEQKKKEDDKINKLLRNKLRNIHFVDKVNKEMKKNGIYIIILFN